MKNKVLYFPYINVPNSMWFTRMLLYWDEVGAIVPYDFIERPDRLDEHTRSLVQATLVKQVIPSEFLYKIPAYTASFVNYLESLGSKLEKRRKSFKGFLRMRRTYKIHIEKMDELGEVFVDMGLAEKKSIPGTRLRLKQVRSSWPILLPLSVGLKISSIYLLLMN